MSKSLQDQLLALGLAKTSTPKAPPKKPHGSSADKAVPDQRNASRKPASDPMQASRSSARPARPGKASGSGHGPKSGPRAEPRVDPRLDENLSLEKAYRIREADEKSAKQRARERKLDDDRQRAELNRQIRQIIDSGRLNLPDASEARYFMYKNRIRKVHVSPEQLAELNSGKLGVVYLAGGYHILGIDHTEQVRKLSPEHVPELLSGADDDVYDEADFTADELRANDPAAADADSADVAATVAGNAGESPNAT